MNDTKAYEVTRAIAHKGDRIERGSILNLTDEEVENIGSENLKDMDETIETPAEETAAAETTAPETTETAEAETTTDAAPAAEETTPAETSGETTGEVEAPATDAAPAAEGAEQSQA
jgi:hypothetical protein